MKSTVFHYKLQSELEVLCKCLCGENIVKKVENKSLFWFSFRRSELIMGNTYSVQNFSLISSEILGIFVGYLFFYRVSLTLFNSSFRSFV